MMDESQTAAAMIRFSEVTKRYSGGMEVLRGVSFDIRPGEMVLLTGPSGAGKTTLLKLIAAIELPTSGSVLVSGQNIGALKPAAVPFLRRKLGLVFQDHKLLFDRNVLNNVLLPLRIAGYDQRDSVRRARAALERVGLSDREKAMPIALSGGEQQRLCIARAVVHRPAVLLADEPTGNLDQEYARGITELFTAFNQVGVTVLIATHDRALQEWLGARTIQIENGRLAASAAEQAA